MNLVIVEIKLNELLFATFRKKRGELSFVEAARHPLGHEESLPQLLEEFAASAPAERRVILAIPSNQLFMRELELPLSDRRKIRELLPLELKGETAVDTDQRAERRAAVGRLAHNFQIRLRVEDRAQSGSNQAMIIGDQNADHVSSPPVTRNRLCDQRGLLIHSDGGDILLSKCSTCSNDVLSSP